MSALLEVEGLNKRFGGVIAAKNIGFSIQPGEILGLIGPNGSGKSTVMKCIMGVERPNSGAVKVDGVDVAGWAPHRIARAGVGIVFQHARPLHRQTILEHIILALLPDNLLMLRTDPAVRRLLGVTGQNLMPQGSPLAIDWAYRVIKTVGNYGELWDRNIGAKSSMKVDRGVNRPWNQGGILFAPAWR